ncbi:MAG TPA: CHAT domain-containing protein, partial [Anaerolineae bacterium]|nr:CHAT domain-containing protein [Anaerolineae bacterium]
ERFQADTVLQAAWQAVQAAQSAYNHAEEAKRAQAEARLAQARQAWYARLREVFPEFFDLPPFDQIACAAGDAPLVYLLATPAGGLALIVSVGAGLAPAPGATARGATARVAPTVRAVWLDELTEKALNERLVKTDKTGENVTGGYLPAQLAVAGWMSDALADLLPWLGKTVMGPVAQALRDQTFGVSETPKVFPVTLIPAGRLALLPLHAARYRRDGREVHFLDEFAVAYAPSALTLRTARRRLAERPPAARRLVGVGNPLPPVEALGDLHRALREAVAALPDEEATAPLRSELARLVARPTGELRHEGFLLRQLVLRLPERLAGAGAHGRASLQELVQRWPLSLRYAKAELQSVVDLLPPGAADPLYEQEATRAALLPHLAGADLLHFSCHGSFDPEEPLDSALHLVGDERLSLREMLDPDFPGLAAVRLATLSACQTAIGDYRNLPEEAIGLPAGLLQAGAPAVIGTLWSVDDASTALLMTRAYERMLQEGEPPLFALRRAQTWLRDLTNAELEAYLAHHEAIAEARRQGAQRMPFALLEELLIQVITAQDPAARPYADPYFWAPFAFYGVEEMPV